MDKIESIRKACRIADDVFSLFIKNIRKFKSEKEARLFIIRTIRKNGHRIAFMPIVASGRNAANPHHKAKDKKLQKGFCVVDLGAKYNGYCCDMTRTLYLGKPTKKERELYNKVLSVQKKAVKMVKVGGHYCDVCVKVRKILGKRKNHFIHSLGHGVGKKVHEKPKVNYKSKEIIKKGQVIAIEPGLYYKKKRGLRIEDTIVIGKKNMVLTKTPKKLIIIA